MDFFEKANQHVKKLNSSEQEIFSYIVRHSSAVQTMNIRTLASNCFVSTTTILRLVRKLGFDGYRDFQDSLKLAMHMEAQQNIPSSLWKESFNKNYLGDIVESFRVIPTSMVERLCTRMHSATRVYCFGSDLDQIIASYAYNVLIRLGISACHPQSAAEIAAAAREVRDDDLLLCFSASGEDRPTIEFVERMLLKRKPAVASITQSGNNALFHMSEFDLYVFLNPITYGGEDLSSRASMLVLIDFISYCLLKSM